MYTPPTEWPKKGEVLLVETPLLKAAPKLLEALKRIADLNPDDNSTEGFNEWGEADCFQQAQTLARAAIKRAE